MQKFDALIIGSGIGGLECAYILARSGMSVCVVEKNAVVGGSLQSFRRGEDEFDTGFHYVGALAKGEILERLFSFFGLMELPWHQLDRDGFDEVFLKDKSYLLSNGHTAFAERLSSYFPNSSEEIKRYSAFLKDVGSKITDPLLKEGNGLSSLNELFLCNAYNFLKESVGEGALLDVISGTSLKLELNRPTLPLYTFAQINNSFVQSAWRLRGRGSQITETLANSIEKMGGVIMRGWQAVEIKEDNGVCSSVEVCRAKNTDSLFADYIISDLTPQTTLKLLKESGSVRKIFRRRINKLEQTYGFFTLNLRLKKDAVPYVNRNRYYYTPELRSVWDVKDESAKGKVCGLLITQQVPKEGERFATYMDILTPMSYAEVAKWADTTVGHRGEEYREFKERKAEECLALAERIIPHLRESVERCYTSTPLTYRDYIGAPEGTAYGIRKDCNSIEKTLLAPKSPLKNLFFTGQNLNLHGILGTSLTALLTCSQILGRESVVRFLK